MAKLKQEYWNSRPQFYAKIPRQNWYEIYKLLQYWQPAPYVGSPRDRVNFREKWDAYMECRDKFEKLIGFSLTYLDFSDHWRDLDMKYLANMLNLKQ